jgi:pyruvate kinase
MGGADAVMLSAETATGKYPVEAVRMMAATAREMEQYQQTHRRILPWQRFFKEDPQVHLGIAYSANRLVELLGGQALMVFTKTGGTAMQVASPKPNVPIFTFTSVRECARRVALIRGTVPIMIKSGHGFLEDLTPFFKKIKETRLVKKGDRIILTTGIPLGIPQWTNVIRVEELP